MSRRSVALAILAGLLPAWNPHAAVSGGDAVAEAKPAAEAQAKGRRGATNPMGPNAACYVCHMTFVREELSRTHLAAKVTCVKCHGVSAKHANDEDIGATSPDRTYERDKVDAMCRKCHETHDVPPQAVVARWLERELAKPPPVCTDCHGTHGIETSVQSEETDHD